MIESETRIRVTDQIEEHIVRTLAYYDIFNYPLKAEEVFHFLGTNHLSILDVQQKLHKLKNIGCVFQFDELYSLKNDQSNVGRRFKGNAEAEKLLVMARKQGHFIAKFPFVRAVMGSGSLSKNYMDENSDLDFFIVTAPGRLWIARMLLVLYKRLFLGNSFKYFCVNYFVDTDHLEIEEKNLFTATELATVIPLYGSEYYVKLHEANRWLVDFFPNYTPRPTTNVEKMKIGMLKKFTEAFINMLFVNRVEKYCMRIFRNHLLRKHNKTFSKADFDVAFKTKNYTSKNHPNHYQRKIMDLYEQKLNSIVLQPK